MKCVVVEIINVEIKLVGSNIDYSFIYSLLRISSHYYMTCV